MMPFGIAVSKINEKWKRRYIDTKYARWPGVGLHTPMPTHCPEDALLVFGLTVTLWLIAATHCLALLMTVVVLEKSVWPADITHHV